LPVMSLSAAANYYALNVSEIEHHIRRKIPLPRLSAPPSMWHPLIEMVK
jgi:hypothetical protein